MTDNKINIEDIDYYIDDLPNHRELAGKIADYVNTHEDYTLAQVASIIDGFYGQSCGMSIAEEIKSIF